jgi:hypothetical protein
MPILLRSTVVMSLRYEGSGTMDGVKKIQRLEEVEVANAKWLTWVISIAALAGGAYFGASSSDCTTTTAQVFCGIAGGVLAQWGVGLLLNPIWPTHKEEKWETVR